LVTVLLASCVVCKYVAERSDAEVVKHLVLLKTLKEANW